MSILNDKQIKKFCELPTFVLIKQVNVTDLEKGTYSVNTRTFTQMTENEILAFKETPEGHNLVDYVPLTEAEAIQLKKMIYPFVDHQVKYDITTEPGKILPVISYGLGSFGYDITLSDEFKVYTNINSGIIDPKSIDEDNYVSIKANKVVIPPNGFILAKSKEYFNIPPVITGLVVSKRAYMQCGVSCETIPLECGWSGHLSLAFSNSTPLPVVMYANEGAAKVLFFRSINSPNQTYRQKRIS